MPSNVVHPDPNPHNFENSDPHKSEKQDPEPHQIKKPDPHKNQNLGELWRLKTEQWKAVNASNGGVEVQKGAVEGL
jgi:hypothetical protein